MMKIKIISAILLLSIFIIGCQPTCEPCPKINCPTVKCGETTEQGTTNKDYLFLHFIDVDQGDAILLKYRDTEMLIDCGRNSKGVEVVEFLEREGVTELDYLLTTHPDADHIGGCDDVLREIRTRVVITNGEQKDTYTYNEFINEIDTEEHIIAREGDVFPLGPVTVEVIQSLRDSSDANENSIVARVDYGDVSALFTGDCHKGCEDELLDEFISVDILKVAHHGTKFATEMDFLEEANPNLAVISVGENNQYGHPAPETIDRLEQERVVIYRTDEDNTVSIRTDGNGYEVI
jgi:competence protein ComEC